MNTHYVKDADNMLYVFTTRHSRVEIRSWDERIVETPENYRFLLGKSVGAAIRWFESIGHVMTVTQDKAPPRRKRVQLEED